MEDIYKTNNQKCAINIFLQHFTDSLDEEWKTQRGGGWVGWLSYVEYHTCDANKE